MQKIVILSLLIIAPFLSSCDTGTEMKDNMQYTTSRIYQHGISDSLTTLLTEGFNSILLPKSNKMLFTYYKKYSSEFRLYNFSINQNELLGNFLPNIDEFSVSPNEDYVTFIKGNELKRLSITSSTCETLFSSSDNLEGFLPSKYSPDGKSIIFLSNKRNSKGSYNSDSIFINIYDIEKNRSIQMDTTFLRNNDMIKVGFLDDSKKFFLSREGYNPVSHLWQFEFSIYNNTFPPTFFSKRRIFPYSSYESKYYVFDHSSIIVFDNNEILFYDLVLGAVKSRIYTDKQFKNARLVKGADYLIEIENNIIYLMDLNGDIIKTFKPNVEENIVWADYFQKNNKIIFRTEKYYNM